MRLVLRKAVLTALLASSLFGASTSVALASTIGFTPTELNAISGEQMGNDGLLFTPTQDIWVTMLGYVAPATSGNLVGIFRVDTNSLLASTTVTTSSTLTGGFFYEAISPLLLTAGVQYAVVGLFNGGGATGYTADSGAGAAAVLGYDGYKYNTNGSLSLPATNYSPAIFGPNLQFTAPDGGATLVLLGMALLGVAVLRRKLRA